MVDLQLNREIPAPVLAAGVALGVLTRAKTRTWADLPGEALADLAPEVVNLLEAHPDVTGSVRAAVRGVDGKSITIFRCPECTLWGMLGTADSEPSTCGLTRGCLGKPVKARLIRIPAVKKPPRAKKAAPQQVDNDVWPVPPVTDYERKRRKELRWTL